MTLGKSWSSYLQPSRDPRIHMSHLTAPLLSNGNSGHNGGCKLRTSQFFGGGGKMSDACPALKLPPPALTKVLHVLPLFWGGGFAGTLHQARFPHQGLWFPCNAKPPWLKGSNSCTRPDAKPPAILVGCFIYFPPKRAGETTPIIPSQDENCSPTFPCKGRKNREDPKRREEETATPLPFQRSA